MPALRFVGIVLGATAIITGVIWVIAQRVARWYIRENARRHKGDGRE